MPTSDSAALILLLLHAVLLHTFDWIIFGHVYKCRVISFAHGWFVRL